MNKSDEQNKKKIKVKTFTVPFDLKEIKENLLVKNKYLYIFIYQII